MAAVVPQAHAQAYGDPSAAPIYYSYPIIKANKPYANSQADTTAAIPGVSGATYLSITLTTKDSASVYIYTDYKPVGGTVWTRIDSTFWSDTVGTGTCYERTLRSSTVGLVTGVAGWLRIRNVFASTGNGVGNPVGTATYNERLNWKP